MPDVTRAQPIAEVTPQPKAPAAKKTERRPHPAVIATLVIAIAVAAAAGAWMLGARLAIRPLAGVEAAVKPEPPAGPLAPYVKGSIAHMMTFAQPRTMGDMAFVDRDHKPVRLSDFRGQVVILNLWATWCAPCRFEMPTLAHLQQDYAGKGLKVVPLSGDGDEKFDDVKSFIDVQEPLDVYVDSSLISRTRALEVSGLPATLIIDRQGREVARLDGEATWDTPEVKALVDKLIAQ